MSSTFDLAKMGAIAGTNVRRLRHDRVGLVFMLVVPFAIILVFGFIEGRDSEPAMVGLVDQSNGPAGAELVDAIRREPLLEVTAHEDEADLRRDIRNGTLEAGIVVPVEYDQAIEAGDAAAVRYVHDPVREAGSARAALQALVAERSSLLQAVRFASARTSISEAEVRVIAERLDDVSGFAVTVVDTDGPAFPTGLRRTAPANLVLFVFLNSAAAAGAIVEARRLGISRRALATPTTTATVVGGEVLGRFVIALAQGVVIVVLSRLLFDVDWGDELTLLALLVSFTLVATGAALLVATIFKGSGSQAASLAPPVAIALGMLGGCMWPLEIVPDTARTIGHATPHAWAIDGFSEAARGGSLGQVAGEVLVLAAFAAGLLLLGVSGYRRSLRV